MKACEYQIVTPKLRRVGSTFHAAISASLHLTCCGGSCVEPLVAVRKGWWTLLAGNISVLGTLASGGLPKMIILNDMPFGTCVKEVGG